MSDTKGQTSTSTAKKVEDKPAASSSSTTPVNPESTEKTTTPDVKKEEEKPEIMDMDEEEEGDDEDGEKHAFSKGIVWGYFEQAEATFKDMEAAIVAEDLTKLSSLGHFLKGSSAALGIIKVQASCEKMQHYGNLRDEEAGVSLGAPEALKRIKELLTACKKDYEVAKNWMENLYEEDK
nr:osomolarity two-component system, phosphorelay intermediate protein YPD1 [Kwoniella mangroviensis CBS 8507]OCF63892.1 osomolarity two-component system, phosphorelay intermediate protein YPD1 [Kwoniella mangroviensis CBS 8507]